MPHENKSVMRALLEKPRYFPDLHPVPPWERYPEMYQGEIRNLPDRPHDYMQPVSELVSPTLGGYGMGQMAGETYLHGREGEWGEAAETGLPLAAMALFPGFRGKKTSGARPEPSAASTPKAEAMGGSRVLAETAGNLTPFDVAEQVAKLIGDDPAAVRHHPTSFGNSSYVGTHRISDHSVGSGRYQTEGPGFDYREGAEAIAAKIMEGRRAQIDQILNAPEPTRQPWMSNRQWREELERHANRRPGWLSAEQWAEIKKGQPQGIRAYHGSPHDFDKFDASRIGTGEGAQAYGHGLYFAESEGVAKAYREALSGGDLTIGGRNVGKAPMPRDYDVNDPRHAESTAAYILTQSRGATLKDKIADAMDNLNMSEQQYVKHQRGLNPQAIEQVRKIITGLGDEGVGTIDAGKMYEVRLNAEPEQFLDWDKPLGQQPAHLELQKKFGKPDVATGAELFRGMQYRLNTGDRGVSEALREAGIPGIRYLDQGSRGKAFRVELATSRGPYRTDDPATFASMDQAQRYAADKTAEGFKTNIVDEGSRNYVVFPGNEHLISIVKKYGIAAAAVMLGMSQSDIAKALEQDNPIVRAMMGGAN